MRHRLMHNRPTENSGAMEREHAFWKPVFTAKAQNLGIVRVYRADTDGQFRDTSGNVMEGGMREESRKAP